VTDLLARHPCLLLYLTTAAVTMVVWASSVVIRRAKAGGSP
jgi:hypothetical protein